MKGALNIVTNKLSTADESSSDPTVEPLTPKAHNKLHSNHQYNFDSMKGTLHVVTRNISTSDGLYSPSNVEPLTPKHYESMRSILEKDFIEEKSEDDEKSCKHNIVTVAASVHKPSLNKNRQDILVRILACSLSTVYETNLGKRKRFDDNTLLMDICGTVEELSNSIECTSKFKIGEKVLATNVMFDFGGVPEYAIIDASIAVKVPVKVDPVLAASCSDATVALDLINNVRVGDRVMIVGGGNSAIGSAAIQLARLAGASYIATTTGSLVHQVRTLSKVNHIISSEEDWTEDPLYLEDKFDKIIDVSVVSTATQEKVAKVLKNSKEGGKLIRRRSNNSQEHNMQLHSRVVKLLEEQNLKIILDPASPLSFSEEGVESAYEIYASGTARGRVVIDLP